MATSEDQRVLSNTVAAWGSRCAVRDLVRADVDAQSDAWRELLPQLAELGLFAAAVPEADGGGGGAFDDTAVLLAACGQQLVPGPLVATAAAALVLAREGNLLAPSLLAGERSAAVPVSAYGGVDPAGVASPVVDGAADLGPVAAWVDGAVLLAPLVVDAVAAWFVIDERWIVATAAESIDGTASVSRVRLAGFDQAKATRLAEPGLMSALLIAGEAAYQAGVAEATLDLAVDYAKVRTQFGAPIGSFQAIKQLCAEMLCRAEQQAAIAWDVAAAVDEVRVGVVRDGRDDAGPLIEQLTFAAAAAAVVTATCPVANAKDAIQILGGIGFTFDHDAHLYLRRALAARIALAHGDSARVLLAEFGRSGTRREFTVDLARVEDARADIEDRVKRVAAASSSDRRAELAATGLLVPHWPRPYGLAADPALQLLIDAELDRAGVLRPDLVIAAWALPTIIEHGTDEQRARFVGPTLAGDITWCQLFSEPEAGSDLASLRTRAERVDGGWRLTGQKIWTSEARRAHWAVCLARTDPAAPKHRGISYFLIDMAAPGIDIRPLRELTGESLFNEVFLDDVFVPDELVVGEVNAGWRLARTTLANERVAMGGAGLGKEVDTLLRQLADSGVELTAPQVMTLGGIIADAHIGRVLDARAVAQRLRGTDPGATSSVRKLIGVVHRQQVPEFALELLGPDGLARSGAGDLFLLNRCLSIAGGTTQILRNAAAERILGLPR